MEKIFIISTIITFLFCLVKFIEMKYLDKEFKPLKFLLRDAVMVFVCSLAAALFVFNMDGSITDFFNVLTDTKTLNTATTQIFTDEPGF
jgi:multisubunit Na+/H+ antiporter MnhB subunit